MNSGAVLAVQVPWREKLKESEKKIVVRTSVPKVETL